MEITNVRPSGYNHDDAESTRMMFIGAMVDGKVQCRHV